MSALTPRRPPSPLTNKLPAELLLFTLGYLEVRELLALELVARAWRDALRRDDAACWRLALTRWRFGSRDLPVTGAAWRSIALDRHRLHCAFDGVVATACSSVADFHAFFSVFITSPFGSARAIDAVYEHLWRVVGDREHDAGAHVPRIVQAFFAHCTLGLSKVLLSQTPAALATTMALRLPPVAIFTGVFTQLFELPASVFPWSVDNFCRSVWSIALIVQSDAAESGVAAATVHDVVPVKVFCCWKKLQQFARPTLAEMRAGRALDSSLPPANAPPPSAQLAELQQGTADWVQELYASLGKPCISVAVGSVSLATGVLRARAIGHTLVRPEHAEFVNVPGQTGEYTFFVDDCVRTMCGMFVLDASQPLQGPGFFRLLRTPEHAWARSAQCSELPAMPIGDASFPHRCAWLMPEAATAMETTHTCARLS